MGLELFELCLPFLGDDVDERTALEKLSGLKQRDGSTPHHEAGPPLELQGDWIQPGAGLILRHRALSIFPADDVHRSFLRTHGRPKNKNGPPPCECGPLYLLLESA